MTARSQRWCFTINNPGDYVPEWKPERMAYLVYGFERAPTTGMPHWQGYVRFKNRITMMAVKNLFARPDMHLSVARGTEQENRDYCMKDGQRVEEHGEYDDKQRGQGKRSDLEAIATRLAAGTTMREVALEHAADFIRYHNGLRALQDLVAPLPPVERPVDVLVLWGPTGTGKTHRILTHCPMIYTVTAGRDPWGRYNGQEAIFFEEFDWSKWTIQQMNGYLDKWRCSLDARYHDRYAAWTRVAICANLSPLTFWPNEDVALVESFRRRIHGKVYHITNQQQEIEDCLDASI